MLLLGLVELGAAAELQLQVLSVTPSTGSASVSEAEPQPMPLAGRAAITVTFSRGMSAHLQKHTEPSSLPGFVAHKHMLLFSTNILHYAVVRTQPSSRWDLILAQENCRMRSRPLPSHPPWPARCDGSRRRSPASTQTRTGRRSWSSR